MRKGKKLHSRRHEQPGNGAARGFSHYIEDSYGWDLRDVKSASMSGAKRKPASATAAADTTSSPLYCFPCKKAFSSDEGLRDHLRDSGKHRRNDNSPVETSRCAAGGISLRPEHCYDSAEVVGLPPVQTMLRDNGKAAHIKEKQAPLRNVEGSRYTALHPSKIDKGKNKQTLPLLQLLADQGYSPGDALTTEDDSSTEELPFTACSSSGIPSPSVTRMRWAGTAQGENESDDESAYFTPEETSVPPRYDQEIDGHGLQNLVLSQEASLSPLGPARVQSASHDAGNRDLLCNHGDTLFFDTETPDRSASAITVSQLPHVARDEILHSDIPRDIYETSDTGGIRCLTCAKWFNNFQGFKQHYQESRMNQEQAPVDEVPVLDRHNQNGPPPLIRVPSEETLVSQSDIGSKVSRGRNQSVRCQQNRFTCRPCRQVFANATALQSHMSAAVQHHPYYCRTCCVEHVNFEALQAHYQHSMACRTGTPYVGEEPLLFSYQAYKAAHLPPSYDNATIGEAPLTGERSKPTGRPTKDMALDDMPMCPICITPLADVTDVTATFCGHVFCAPCILDHLRRRNSCPQCRKLISSMMLIPLFF